MEFRKRGRLSRGAKLNQFQNNKDKYLTIAAKSSRSQQQHNDKGNKKLLIKRETLSASSKYGYQNDLPTAHNDPEEDSTDEYEDSGSDPEDPPPIRTLQLLSNPEYWSPMDTARFLAQTSDCQHLAHLV